MAAYVPTLGASRPQSRATLRAMFVLLAIVVPLLAGLAWHQASDNPAWPLMQNSLNLCELHDSPRSPVSPDGRYRAHVVQATCLGRFSETLVFLTEASAPWSSVSLNHNRAVAEIAGQRSLDAINWRGTSGQEEVPVLQLWFTPDAAPAQIHRMDRLWNGINIESLTSSPAPGAERLDY